MVTTLASIKMFCGIDAVIVNADHLVAQSLTKKQQEEDDDSTVVSASSNTLKLFKLMCPWRWCLQLKMDYVSLLDMMSSE